MDGHEMKRRARWEDRKSRIRHQKQWHLTTLQTHLVAASGEFVGTFFFLFFGYAGHLMVVNQSNTSQVETPGVIQTVCVAYAYGFSLLVTVWAFYRISGGLFNPAVTLGLCIAGALPWARAAFLVPTQIVASMCAGGLVEAMFTGSISSVNTTLIPGMSIAKGLFAEMFFTSYLVFVILMLAIEKSRDTFIAPVGIGLALFVAEVPGVYYTGGPAMGGALAAAYYRFVKLAHYEEANPGQDASQPDEA
ncbi:hypothetical protein TruAng_004971 [Truncatella angustata]|nr:hypothetical protein TruAng_004971 [Truncatella angustata]